MAEKAVVEEDGERRRREEERHCSKLVGRRRDIVVVAVGKSVTIYLTGVVIYNVEGRSQQP